jgi:hypothetical protein
VDVYRGASSGLTGGDGGVEGVRVRPHDVVGVQAVAGERLAAGWIPGNGLQVPCVVGRVKGRCLEGRVPWYGICDIPVLLSEL